MHVPTRKRWLRVSFCTELMHLDGALRDNSADVFENIIVVVSCFRLNKYCMDVLSRIDMYFNCDAIKVQSGVRTFLLAAIFKK